ncbi:MAG: CaiB/BaiF CoA transferase family protein [Solirubrobacteraceae bacterium]
MEAESKTPTALGGIRILDFSRVLAGPLATMVLADLGAEVLKVERPGVGDDTRAWGPPYDANGQASYFDSVNRNKTSITIDLQDARQRAHITTVAAGADIIVENFRPGLMDELGLGYADLRALNPGLIYCSISGFGATEQAAALPGYDLLVQALGGLMSITGSPDGEPQKVGVALVDVITGLFASVGILAALRHRERTGQGQLVEVDLLSCLLAALVNQGSAFTAGGVVPRRLGNAHPSIAPYELYPTGDGDLVLAVGNDKQFRALCDVLGGSELAQDVRFSTNPLRVANREALRVELVRLLAAGSAADWTARLTEARVPAGEVNDIGAAFALAARLGLNPTVDLPPAPEADRVGEPTDGPPAVMVTVQRNPIRLSVTPPTYRSAPPPLGPPAV